MQLGVLANCCNWLRYLFNQPNIAEPITITTTTTVTTVAELLLAAAADDDNREEFPGWEGLLFFLFLFRLQRRQSRE